MRLYSRRNHPGMSSRMTLELIRALSSTSGAGLLSGTLQEGGMSIETPQAHPQTVQGIRRRERLKAGLVAGAALSTWSLPGSPALWGAEAGQPKRGGTRGGKSVKNRML